MPHLNRRSERKELQNVKPGSAHVNSSSIAWLILVIMCPRSSRSTTPLRSRRAFAATQQSTLKPSRLLRRWASVMRSRVDRSNCFSAQSLSALSMADLPSQLGLRKSSPDAKRFTGSDGQLPAVIHKRTCRADLDGFVNVRRFFAIKQICLVTAFRLADVKHKGLLHRQCRMASA